MGKEEPSSTATKVAWPSFLRGTASEVLARLGESDPLRLCEGSARRLRESWILLDPDRVHHRAIAVCAEAAPREEAPRDLAAWARAKIDVAIEQLVRRDRENEQAHPDQLEEEEMNFPLLTESLMLEPELVRRVCVAFNQLEPLPRRAFFELLIEGRELPEVLEAGPWDEDGLHQALQTALATVSLDVSPESKDDPAEETKQ